MERMSIMTGMILIILSSISISFCQNTSENISEQSSDKTPNKKVIKMPDDNILAAVMYNGSWGYIDQSGKFVIEAKFPQAHNFSDGFACVNVGGKRINAEGGVVGGKYTFIDKDGKWMGWQFDDVSHFSEGHAAIKQAGYAFLIKTNEDMLGSTFDAIGKFDGGLAPAQFKDKGQIGYIDEFGAFKIKTDPSWLIFPFSEGLARVKVSGKWGFIDQNGELVIDPIYSNAYSFNEGLAAVVENGKFGFINTSGKMVVEAQFDDAGDFSEGMAGVQKEGKWGYINNKGKLIIATAYTNVRDFNEGLAAAQQDNKVGYLDKEGNFKIEPAFSASYDFSYGLATFQQGGLIGYINNTGEIVIPAQFERASNFVQINESNKMERIN